MSRSIKKKKIYMIAGEPSGDQLGGLLMHAMQKESVDQLLFQGIGGAQMTDNGLKSLFDMADISLMGLTEILPHVRTLKRRIRQTADDILQCTPDVLVTIDSPGFCHRVIEQLKKHKDGKGFRAPIIHYVAPTVWAWKPHRAAKLAGLVDHLLVLLPFEPPYFEKEGLKTTFVGHPVLSMGIKEAKSSLLRKKLNIKDKNRIVTLLPGSRKGELSRHMPIFRSVAEKLSAQYPDLTFVLPTLPHLQLNLRRETRTWSGVDIHVFSDKELQFSAYKASDIALAASGTVSVELAVAGCPAIVGYKFHPLTYAIARRMVKTPYASLVNIMADAEIIPELLQRDMTAENLAFLAETYLENPGYPNKQKRDAKRQIAKFAVKEDYASQLAAKTVLSYIN